MQAKEKPSPPKEAIFELQPEHLPQLPCRSEADENGFLHSEEGFLNSVRQALLSRELVASQEELPLLQLCVPHRPQTAVVQCHGYAYSICVYIYF